mgnify:CR=1 FL=1
MTSKKYREKLTNTGIVPNYVNIDLFAKYYNKTKLMPLEYLIKKEMKDWAFNVDSVCGEKLIVIDFDDINQISFNILKNITLNK